MKITYKNKKPDLTFGDIEVGQTFFDEDFELCIKVDTRCDEWNCVSLSENAIYSITDHTMVTPVNVELIVDGEGRSHDSRGT